MKNFTQDNQIVIQRSKLKDEYIDIKGKTIIIGFNEPPFKKSKNIFLDAKLNARFISYFLPAVEIARKQKQRPRFFIVSAINLALNWNAKTEEERKIMMANNAIKLDFLKKFFETFFYDDFSLIEYIIPQDTLKIPEKKILALWNIIEKKHPQKIKEIKFQLTKFLYPKQFNVKKYIELSEIQKEKLKTIDASKAFKYAISHLFVFADVNFTGNYIHNPNGYISIGGENEIFFNTIRNLAFHAIKDYGELLFERKITFFENYHIVLKNKFKVPPPYNGIIYNKDFLEVTYENKRNIDFYDSQEKLKDQMEYIYQNIINKESYEKFWKSYEERYFKLKEKYRVAYQIQSEW